MKNKDIVELIEQYLKDALPPEEKLAVETRMAADASFRSEVELHRQLHQEFADTRKLHLRDLLTDMLQDPPPPPTATGSRVKWLVIAGVTLLLGSLCWYLLSPRMEETLPAKQEELKSAPPSSEPIATPEKENSPSEPVEEKQKRPIAKADPAAYTPNPNFENRLGSMIRATDGSVEMASPAMGATLKVENGVVKLNFRGKAPADADEAEFPLVLKIYDNKAVSDKFQYRITPAISDRNNSNQMWTFSASQRLRLRPGLYYYTLERQADEDLIFVGKFRVE